MGESLKQVLVNIMTKGKKLGVDELVKSYAK